MYGKSKKAAKGGKKKPYGNVKLGKYCSK